MGAITERLICCSPTRARTWHLRINSPSLSYVILLHHQLLTASAHLRHRSRMQCNARVCKTTLLRFCIQVTCPSRDLIRRTRRTTLLQLPGRRRSRYSETPGTKTRPEPRSLALAYADCLPRNTRDIADDSERRIAMDPKRARRRAICFEGTGTEDISARAERRTAIDPTLVDAIAASQCRMAPRPGLEPGTCGLTVRRSGAQGAVPTC